MSRPVTRATSIPIPGVPLIGGETIAIGDFHAGHICIPFLSSGPWDPFTVVPGVPVGPGEPVTVGPGGPEVPIEPVTVRPSLSLIHI